MTAAEIEITDAPDDQLTITMRGKAEDIIKVLVQGLDRDSLVIIRDAMEAELDAGKQK